MHTDLVAKIVYVKPRNKLIIVRFHQHEGDRSIRKAIKGSMILNDSFVYFEITGIKECNKTWLENNKRERTLANRD